MRTDSEKTGELRLRRKGSVKEEGSACGGTAVGAHPSALGGGDVGSSSRGSWGGWFDQACRARA